MKDDVFQILDSRHLHRSVVEVSGNRFANGDYWAAILSAATRVESKVKEVLGVERKLSDPIGYAFDGNEPRIRLAHDLEIHKGLAMIYKGMMKAIRNPKAHDSFFTQNDPGRTLDYLGLMSLLLRRIDERVSPPTTTSDKTHSRIAIS